ncbi:MAG TPA: Nramp family divalent metal transporter [Bryobacteraceae bacterium]|nr:Nramp family divalent metal transporter [Bryobacteraceae bacterium]
MATPIESTHDARSLANVHSTVGTSQLTFWRRMFAFAGPAYLVSVGYMDPGNWATDLEGGARFGYRLLWVLVMSNAMAILLQTLAARLGIVSGRDLAQACRERYPRPVTFAMWILCEIAIAACDLAEVLGAAIALNMLFHIPLVVGVILTGADTLLLLAFQSFGIRFIEAFILSLITIIAACFCIEVFWAHPVWTEVFTGLAPRLNGQTLYLAVAILGATVMPHNLYLHSALVQTRAIGRDESSKRAACRFNLIDSVVALNGAMFVNCAILVLAAAVFFKHGIVVTEIQQAQQLLVPLLSTTLAGVIFAIALLCSGQSSTLTGTLAGQITMEGFLNLRMRPWLRRLTTRSIAIIPAALTIKFMGDSSTLDLLLLSQVIISMQLPFAVIPLIHFTNDRERMGSFANRAWVKALSWICAAVILGLNFWIVAQAFSDWLAKPGAWGIIIRLVTIPAAAAITLLLAWISCEPLFTRWRGYGRAPVVLPETATDAAPLVYRRILVTVDHSELDSLAVSHASAMGQMHAAKIYVLHVEEGVTSQVYGQAASTAETEAGEQYVEHIAQNLRNQGLIVETSIVHSAHPDREIVRYAQDVRADLVIMGAHGHGGLKDLIFGNTINPVRHHLTVPMLIVRPGKS